jgi:Spy/CpxP family protein refolding chaperone
MKARFLAIAILWMGAALAQAPDTSSTGGPGPGPGPGRESPAQRMDRLATILDLTDAQKTQVGAVLEEEHAKMRQLREQAQASGQKPTFEQMKAVHDQVTQETISKLTPILTADQLKKFQALMEERGPPGHPH